MFGWQLTDKVTWKSIRTISNFTDLIQFHLIWQILAKFSLGPYLSLTKFRKRKRQFLCCVHLLHKAGSWNKEISCRRGAMMAKKCTKSRDSRAKLLLVNMSISFLPFSLPSPSSWVLLSSRNSATVVTWHHSSALYYRPHLSHFWANM